MNPTEQRITVLAARTLAAVVISMLLVLLYGLFDHRVDNQEIFAIINPAFNMIVGAFVGVIAGIHIGKNGKE